jgi:hypothetical protein
MIILVFSVVSLFCSKILPFSAASSIGYTSWNLGFPVHQRVLEKSMISYLDDSSIW